MRVMLSARTLFRRGCSRPGENSVRRVCGRRPRREPPKSQDNPSTRLVARTWCFFPLNSGRPLVQGTTRRESKTRRRKRFTWPLQLLYEEQKNPIFRISYMTNLQTATVAHVFPWVLIWRKSLRFFIREKIYRFCRIYRIKNYIHLIPLNTQWACSF